MQSEQILSVVIPCHNVHKYITRCLDCLERQTIGMDRLQVILVDDASTDDTLTYLEQFESEYPDMTSVIVSQTNIGAAAARNLGLEYATGDYLAFVDADDMIADDMFLDMIDKLEEFHCDMVECDYLMFSSEEELTVSAKTGEALQQTEKADAEHVDGRFYDCTNLKIRKEFIINHGMKSAVWGRVYRRKFITDNQLYFAAGTLYEDVYYSGIAMFLYSSVYCLPAAYYYYYQNPNGVISTTDSASAVDSVSTIRKLITELDERGQLECVLTDYYQELEYYCVRKSYADPVQLLLRVSQNSSEQEKQILFYAAKIKELFPDVVRNQYVRNMATQNRLWRLLLNILERG